MNRSAIVRVVSSSQGIAASELADTLGMKPSALSYHLQQLIASKDLFFVWDDGRKRLFAPGKPEASP